MAIVFISGERTSETNGTPNGTSFTVTLSEAETEQVLVPYRTFAGTAHEDADFGKTFGTLVFEPGETLKTVGIGLGGGIEPEPDESITFEVVTPTNAELPGGAIVASTVGWVLDDDGFENPLALWISDPVVREDDLTGRIDFDFRLSAPAPAPIAIPYRTDGTSAGSGVDYEPVSGEVLLPAGTSEATVSVPLLDDGVVEGVESLRLRVDLPDAIAEAIGGTARIIDDDAGDPVVFARGERTTETNGVPNDTRFVVTLSAPSEEVVEVPYRLTAGTATDGDFGAGTGTLVFQPGEVQQQITTTVAGGIEPEADESLILELTTPTGAVLPGLASITRTTAFILDNDGSEAPLSLAVTNPVVREPDGGARTATFEFALSQTAPEDIEIPFETFGSNATAGADFVATSGTVVIPRGQREASVGVEILGDTEIEGQERVDLRLTLPSLIAESTGGQASIFDNDPTSGPEVSVEDAQIIALLYEAGLDRDGAIDLPGLNFWIDQRANGLSETEIAREFLDSPEFAESFGAPNTLDDFTLVTTLYENVLDRAADEPGRQFWLGVLQGEDVDRAELLALFAVSPENREGSAFVDTLSLVGDGEWAFLG